MTRTDYIAFLEERKRMLEEFDDYCDGFLSNNGRPLLTDREETDHEQMKKLLAKIIEAHEVAIAISFKTRADRIATGHFEQAEMSLGINITKPLWYIRELDRREELLDEANLKADELSDAAEVAEAREMAEMDPLFQQADEEQTAARETELKQDEPMVGPIPKRVIDECYADIERRKAEKEVNATMTRTKGKRRK